MCQNSLEIEISLFFYMEKQGGPRLEPLKSGLFAVRADKRADRAVEDEGQGPHQHLFGKAPCADAEIKAVFDLADLVNHVDETAGRPEGGVIEPENGLLVKT